MPAAFHARPSPPVAALAAERALAELREAALRVGSALVAVPAEDATLPGHTTAARLVALAAVLLVLV